MRKTSVSLSLRLGPQVQRVRVRQHGHSRFQAVPGGDTFARLFPSLVGRHLAIGEGGVDLVNEPEMIRAVGWLSANGYFLRGGLQS